MKHKQEFLVHLLAMAHTRLSWLPALLTRIAIGSVFIESGWGKLHNLEKVVSYFISLGIPFAGTQAPVVAATELICGWLVLVGLMSRLAAIPLIGIMSVATLTAKLADISEWTDLFGFSETLYIILLLWLASFGPGPVSFDALLLRRFTKRAPGLPSLG